MSGTATASPLPVVAIGASAGGLEACRALVKDIPPDVRAAFILVQHLDPGHASMMVELLAPHTRLKVLQAVGGAVLGAGCLYVIPPGSFLTVAQRTLHLSGPDDGQPVRLPFDVLLTSLAKDIGDAATCIVLSGTGADGSQGLLQIHAAGGHVLAQDPDEAGYRGMPDSAIATGKVAEVLPASRLFAAVQARFRLQVAEGPGVVAPPDIGADDAGAASVGANLDAVLSLVGTRALQDLSLYKRGTLERRISRRMALHGFAPGETGRYLALLHADPEEGARLADDLLIHVTGFFRDPEVFERLSDAVFPELLASLSGDRALRVWVAGCSTGEEAYSLTIALTEAVEAAGSNARLQVFASDVDTRAITSARAGFYPNEIATAVSPRRLARFFVAENGGWRVASALRDMIVFSVADLLSDPPFSRIDLLSCRNVLIYLDPAAQRQVVGRCCFALRPGGLLLLGAVETPGQGDACLAVEDKAIRLWRRVGRSQLADLHVPSGKRHEGESSPSSPATRRITLADLCRRTLLETYAPAAVLLNRRLDCVYLFGATERYLKVTQGHPDTGIIRMLPKEIRTRFRAAAEACTEANPVARVSGRQAGRTLGFDISVHTVSGGDEPLLLACFIDTPERPNASDGVPDAGTDQTQAELEADLAATRIALSDALRDLDHEVDAHGADAAEALSVHEEFQSTNEELLASKEELQALNEELTALNVQLQETLERHRTTANDLQNVLYSTDVATLFLDRDLNIRFFTPAARAIFHVIPTDVGRPLADLAAVSRDDELAADARIVLAKSDAVEREIAGADGGWFLRRVHPYRAEDRRVDGVVITYVDISERKRNNAALRAAMDEAQRATRAKSRFLASASHDLRQPLQSMALLNKLISGHRKSSEGTRLTALLDQTLNSMTEMLDSMLDVNRIESGIIRPDLRPVAVGPLLHSLAAEFGPQCELRRLKLRVVPSTAWVRTDPQLLGQILRNLLSNAVKYTPRGGILMGCRRHGTDLSILVCDSGIGVSDAEAATIFDAYRQGERAAALTGGGLGLGLSIVQRLARLMDHPVTLRSTPGKGSTFMITLPVTDAMSAVPARQAMRGLSGPSRQRGTILLVEDEDQLRDLLEEVLSKEGHTVIAHRTSQDALAWASSVAVAPDLLLTDFDLRGGTNGLSLAQDVPNVLGISLPTVILTGDITTDTMQRIAGSSCHQVTKPVMPEILLAQISDLLRKDSVLKQGVARRSDAAGLTVHVIDDNPMICETMRRLFEAQGWDVVTHVSAEAFLSSAPPIAERSACLLVDNVLPGIAGVELITRLRAQRSQVPVVMLTAHGDAAVAVSAMKAGATDLIEKPASAADLLAAVRSAIAVTARGQPREQAGKEARMRFDGLTGRERDVLHRVLAGAPNKIIAADLGINQRTVENHRASVMRKVGARSLPELVRLALAADLRDVT